MARPTLAIGCLALSAALGCTDVEIVADLELDGDGVLVVPGTTSAQPSIGVGMIDGWVLLQWPEPGPGELDWIRYAWLDDELRMVGAPGTFGLGGGASQWERSGDSLVGQVWADPGGDPDIPNAERVYGWRLRPPGAEPTEESVRIESAVSVSDIYGYPVISLGGLRSPGRSGRLPTAVDDRGAVGAFIGPPDSCGSSFASADRLHLFRWGEGVDPVAAPIQYWTGGLCDGIGPEGTYAAAVPWLFRTHSGLAALYAEDKDDWRLRLVSLGAALEPRTTPLIVGRDDTDYWPGGGFQPRAVEVLWDRVLFTERRGAHGNTCRVLRVVDVAAGGATDAPWQLSCRAQQSETGALELVGVPEAGVLVWSEHSYRGNAIWITEDMPYQEGVYATVIGSNGRRGSDIVRVTPEGSTALRNVPRTAIDGPEPADYQLAAASEGGMVVVAWYDRRPDAPGIYVRRLRVSSRS